ncbi:MAG: hypothetical protein U0992_02080 [Planctomycetaceae bacterium]
MSRRRSDEPTFSTDSFLDVVCNLVGIMIILIIVAGMRVTSTPIVFKDDDPAPDEPLQVASEADIAGINLTEVAKWLEQPPEAPEEPPADEPPAEEPPVDLVAQADQLRQQMTLTAAQVKELQARAATARRQRAAADAQVRGLVSDVKSAENQAKQKESDAEQAAHAVHELEARSMHVEAQTAALADQPVQGQVVKHVVTPISRQVSEHEEVHFRLSGNRVSVVPLDELAEALKFRMERSRDMFLRVNRYEGTAGPVDGYLMRYVIEKQQPSAIEQLRNGGPFMRVQLTYYELEVGQDVKGESLEEALKPGSRFITALAGARPGTSLTFWVYPDSFELHRKLQEIAHEARFDVAARPLPMGVPIAGSPNGSKSAAQ